MILFIHGDLVKIKKYYEGELYTEAKGGGAKGDGATFKMFTPSEKKSVIHE